MSDIKQFEPLWGVWTTEQLIGEGSFGKVYRAVREEFGKKYYSAIKHISIPVNQSQVNDIISEGISDDRESIKDYFTGITQNLMNEIAFMNEVKGRTNIVSYEDHLIIPKPDGIGYDIIIRMELLTGLNEILRRRNFTNTDVIHLGVDICSALEVCYEKGIIHRDIKPSNIFVSDTDDYKLGDFGVARQLERTTAGMSKKGTYAYMAPEVYRGEPANFTADIFSLGIVMYRLLNGNRSPFLPTGKTKIGVGDNEAALAKKMSGEPLPPPVGADKMLAAVILKATEFDKSKRYATPTEFKTALQALLDDESLNMTVSERAVPVNIETGTIKPEKSNETDKGGLLDEPAGTVLEASALAAATKDANTNIKPMTTEPAAITPGAAKPAEKKAEEKPKSRKKKITAIICGAAGAAIIIAAGIIGGSYSSKVSSYNEAVRAYNRHDYANAYVLFTNMGSFDNSSEMAVRSKLYDGVRLSAAGKYDEAEKAFNEVAGKVDAIGDKTLSKTLSDGKKMWCTSERNRNSMPVIIPKQESFLLHWMVIPIARSG